MTRHTTTGGKTRRPKTAGKAGRQSTAEARHTRPRRSNLDELRNKFREQGRELAAARSQLAEALEQQTAMSDVLGVISNSPTDLTPVFQVIVERAARLCDAYDVAIWRPHGDRLHLVAHHGPIFVESVPLVREGAAGRALLDKRTVHIADLQAETAEFPEGSRIARDWNFRSVLSLPLMREGDVVGVIALRRQEVQLFTDKQIELVPNFAA
jgi:two-component system NtrC family sensor kinase